MLADELEARLQNKTRHIAKAEKLREWKRKTLRKGVAEQFAQFALRPLALPEQQPAPKELGKLLMQLEQINREKPSLEHCSFERLGLFESRRKFGDLLSHHFASLELHGGSRRDLEAASGLIGVAAYSFFGQSNFKYPEIPQFDIFAARQSICDQIECLLDYFKHLMLNQTGFVTDLYNNVPLCQVSHGESFPGSSFYGTSGGPCRQRRCCKLPTLSLFRTIDEIANEARI